MQNYIMDKGDIHIMKNQQIKLEYVNVSEALRYLGYGLNEPDPKIKELLSLCEKELLDVVRPKFVYKIFELDEEKNIISCDFILRGKDIKKHLSGCNKAIFLCVTLSTDVDRLIRIRQIGDMAKAAIIDSMASALVEQACDQAERIISRELPDYKFTWRFGLGYGDFPLESQKQFLNILDAQKKIGVCVNNSLMLTPTKTVTCIIGAGKNITKGNNRCNNCKLFDRCQYRKKGESCGN